MAKSVTGVSGELVRVLTEDGLELNGLYCGPIQQSETRVRKSGLRESGRKSPGPGPCCVVHVHGWDGNFYENRFLDHAAGVCSRLGIGFVSGNNRGHDYIADVLKDSRPKAEAGSQKSVAGADRAQSQALRAPSRESSPGYAQVGGIYEALSDCVPDIRAWVDFATRRGAKRVILQGHSHGAIKAAHYLLATGDRRVRGLILLSPSDDMGIARRDLGPRQFERLLDTAHALTHAGMGRQLLPDKELKYPVSAATFFDCHNKDSITGMFNLSRTDRKEFPELAAIRLPVLMAVGTVEEAFVGEPAKYVEDVGACLVNCPSFTGAVVDGAPHNYLGREKKLAGVLEKWLAAEFAGS